MWNQNQLADDLRSLGLERGDHVLVHASMRAIGPIEGGLTTLASAFRDVLGESGTLLVPAFTRAAQDPVDYCPPEQTTDCTSEEQNRWRVRARLFDVETTPAERNWMSVFYEVVRRLPEARRSNHPLLSFVAVGSQAEFFTRNVPFHFPLGSDSPLARLHQTGGKVLLLGVDHRANASLHLAEVWANVPYVQRSTHLLTAPEVWTPMEGYPACQEGFGRVDTVLRQARISRRGRVGEAATQVMRQQFLISMAVEMLQGNGESLLCNNPCCHWCARARRLTAIREEV